MDTSGAASVSCSWVEEESKGLRGGYEDGDEGEDTSDRSG